MGMKFQSSFRGYSRKNLKRDLMAALVVTAIAVPESLGFAAIVGLPLQTGLYCALFAPIIFAILTSSRRVVVGADSATATLVAAGGATVATVGSAAYTNSIAVLGILTAIALVIMAIARFGFLADFISRPVLVGFFAGIGVQLMVGKLPELLGLTIESDSLLETLALTVTNLGQINTYTLIVSVCVIGVALLIGNHKYPGALIGLAAGSALAVGFGLKSHGVEFVGQLPAGFPQLVIPDFNIATIIALIPSAFSIALVIIAQGTSVIRSLGAEHDEPTDITQDMMAFGAANATSALTQGFAINGSPPRSIAADLAGGRSQMVNVFMGIFVGLVLLFATGLFQYVPHAALAGIVFIIGVHLFRIDRLTHIYHVRRKEFLIAIAALVGVAVFGVMQGVIIAVVISLMERLHRQYHPSDQILLRDGQLSDWANERIKIDHRHSREAEGLLVYRFNGSIFFENADYFVSRVQGAIHGAKQPVNYVIVDAGAIDDVDYTAVTTIRDLASQLHADNIQLGFAHVAPNLNSQLERYGLIEAIGSEHIFPTLAAAVDEYPKGRRDVIEIIKRLDLTKDEFVVIGGGVMEALGLRDTHGVDMVVSEAVYRRYRDEHAWHEYIQDNGKRILVHHGYHMMRSWLGDDLRALLPSSKVIEGIRFMSPSRMIKTKRRLGRKKDLEDVKLLRAYLRDRTAARKAARAKQADK